LDSGSAIVVNTALKIPLGLENIQVDHSSGKARASKLFQPHFISAMGQS